MVFRVASAYTTTGGGVAGYYGAFHSAVDQTDGVSPVAMAVELTDLSNGITVVANGSSKKTRITFANAGTYNIQFSAQFHNTGGGGSGNTANIWFALNGTAVADSNTKLTVPSNAPYVVAAWNFMVTVAATNYIEIFWFTDNANVIIEAEAATATTPAVPSANQVG
jgi:hypothetical protein